VVLGRTPLELARGDLAIMTLEVINPLPVQLDATGLRASLKGEIPGLVNELMPLLDVARSKIEPKAVYAVLRVQRVDWDQVFLEDGKGLSSVVLGDMLRPGQSIVPHVITLGSELEAASAKETNLLRSWLLEVIADYALTTARQYVKTVLTHDLGTVISIFSPGTGTGELFGLDQQETLFRILDPSKNVGVNLLPSLLMTPRKSVSGIFAATREEYVACEYCPRKCESRAREFKGAYQFLRGA